MTTSIKMTITPQANVWTEADQQHLMACIEMAEQIARTAVTHEARELRATLTESLRGHLKTMKDIQYAAQNCAIYLTYRLALLETGQMYFDQERTRK